MHREFERAQRQTWLDADFRTNLALLTTLGLTSVWLARRGPGLEADPVLWATFVALAACVAECWVIQRRGRKLLKGSLVPLGVMAAAVASTWFNRPENSIWVIAVLALVFIRFRLRTALLLATLSTAASVLVAAYHWQLEAPAVLRTLLSGLLMTAILATGAAASRATTARLADMRRLLKASMEGMAQGLAVFGPRGEVKLFNAKIFDMLDLPREWIHTRPRLEDALEVMRRRGDFDDVSPRMEPTAREALRRATGRTIDEFPSSYTRRTPDGRYIAIMSLPMENGDTVRTYTDVTSFEIANRQLEAVLQDYGELRQRELSRSRESMVEALSQLALYRDHETGKHVVRTQLYVRVLAESLARAGYHRDELDEAAIELLVKAAPMHDLGKIGVPDHILLKKGRHNPEESALMKSHAAIGESTLLQAARGAGAQQSLFAVAAQIAGGHHENWDGSGYPRGLVGEDIPLAARLMALADVYDALTTPRVYKRAWTHDEARAEIGRLSGTKFDPKVAAAFEAEQLLFRRIAEQHRDVEPEAAR